MERPPLSLLGFDPENLSAKDLINLRLLVDQAQALLHRGDEHAAEIGNLCITWAYMDRNIDRLFQPLLECSAQQVACILVENIDARCGMLKRLLVVADIPKEWLEWIIALLNRASSELAPIRNRVIHDAWHISESSATRIDKRAKITKAQSRENDHLSFDTEHVMDTAEITILEQKVSTVSVALEVAAIALERWRIKAAFPEFDPQWLPACKRTARCPSLMLDGEVHEIPLAPLQFEFE